MLSAHSSSTQMQTLHCNYCLKKFSEASRLERHKRLHWYGCKWLRDPNAPINQTRKSKVNDISLRQESKVDNTSRRCKATDARSPKPKKARLFDTSVDKANNVALRNPRQFQVDTLPNAEKSILQNASKLTKLKTNTGSVVPRRRKNPSSSQNKAKNDILPNAINANSSTTTTTTEYDVQNRISSDSNGIILQNGMLTSANRNNGVGGGVNDILRDGLLTTLANCTPNKSERLPRIYKQIFKEDWGGVSHTCDVCMKTYKSYRLLRDHKARQHSGISHPCGVCGKGFTTLNICRRHEREVSCLFNPSTSGGFFTVYLGCISEVRVLLKGAWVATLLGTLLGSLG